MAFFDEIALFFLVRRKYCLTCKVFQLFFSQSLWFKYLMTTPTLFGFPQQSLIFTCSKIEVVLIRRSTTFLYMFR